MQKAPPPPLRTPSRKRRVTASEGRTQLRTAKPARAPPAHPLHAKPTQELLPCRPGQAPDLSHPSVPARPQDEYENPTRNSPTHPRPVPRRERSWVPRARSPPDPRSLTSKRPLLLWMARTRPKSASSRPSTSPHASLQDTERQRPPRHGTVLPRLSGLLPRGRPVPSRPAALTRGAAQPPSPRCSSRRGAAASRTSAASGCAAQSAPPPLPGRTAESGRERAGLSGTAYTGRCLSPAGTREG